MAGSEDKMATLISSGSSLKDKLTVQDYTLGREDLHSFWGNTFVEISPF
jgi:hypothetical protein